jgi:large conductance mechanosensitive channel
MPPIGLILGGIDFSDFFVTLKGGSYATLDEAKKAGAVTINYGVFINSVVNFLIVAFAVFILVKQVNRLYRTEPPPPAKPSRQEELLAEIRDLLRQAR